MNKFANRTTWSPERDALATALWKAGQSGGQIAKRLGVTRNSAIGRIHRLGLTQHDGVHRTGRPKRVTPAPPRKRTYKPKKRERKAFTIGRMPVAERPAPRLELVQKRETQTSAHAVRFLDRRMHVHCCAILNDGAPIDALMVCGGPIPIESQFDFCEAHAAVFLTSARKPPTEYGTRAA